MRRNALRHFFERVLVASLPLAVTNCGEGAGGQDLGIAIADLQAPGDLRSAGPVDLAIADLSPPPSCETQHPTMAVMIAEGSFPDGGDGCFLGQTCVPFCPTGYTECCGPVASDGGAQLAVCYYNCPDGRRPAGLQDAQAKNGCVVGRHFARVAHLEAASVGAFRILARELSAHGAPRELIHSAKRSARDEVRHARLMTRIARAHGSAPARVEVLPSSIRSLEEIAIENAAEGCVRETLGALVAFWQSRTANDPFIRKAMVEIARDEMRHAELAWAVDAWASDRLGRPARRRIASARRAAATTLLAEIAEPPTVLRTIAGLPSARQSRDFMSAGRRELWS